MFKFSLVIPAYNESAYLPRLLDTVDEARANFQGGFDAIEVIVADNCSRDETASIACDRGCVVTHVTKRCIASVRNGGAKIAKGRVLCFVDADMRIHPQTFNVIENCLDTGNIIAGATGAKFDRMSFGIAVTYGLLVPVFWLTKIDGGVVFCRKADFELIGGYNETMNFGEDVRFLLEIRELGRKRDQKLSRPAGAKAIGSARKYDQHGDWHFLLMMVEIMRGGGFKVDQNSGFVDRYWYGNQREP